MLFQSISIHVFVIAMLTGAFPFQGTAQSPDKVLAQRQAQIVKLVREHFLNAQAAEQWAAQHEHFADRARDEASFSRLAKSALADLKTSHTGYYDRDDPEYYALLSIFAQGALYCQPSSGTAQGPTSPRRTLSGSFSPGAPRRRLGSGAGTGSRLPTASRSIASTHSGGEQGSPWRVRVRRHQTENPITVSITPRRIEPKKEWLEAQKAGSRIIEERGKRIGYVPMFSCAGDEFLDALQEILTDKLREADALVIDFRDGFGGCNPSFVNLFNRQPPVLTSIDRNGEKQVMDAQWRKPVVLLINGGSRSGKEVVAAALKKHKLATLVGERTAGAVVCGQMLQARGRRDHVPGRARCTGSTASGWREWASPPTSKSPTTCPSPTAATRNWIKRWKSPRRGGEGRSGVFEVCGIT